MRKRIQEVIEIEKQAQQLLATARRAAEDLPAKAEVEAREIVEQARKFIELDLVIRTLYSISSEYPNQ